MNSLAVAGMDVFALSSTCWCMDCSERFSCVDKEKSGDDDDDDDNDAEAAELGWLK